MRLSRTMSRMKNKLANILFGADLFAQKNELRSLKEELDELRSYVKSEKEIAILESERKLSRKIDEEVNSFREQISSLKAQSTLQEEQLKSLDCITRGIEKIITRLSTPNVSDVSLNRDAKSCVSTENTCEAPDYSYLLLENRFRGAEEEISKRLEIYPALFKNSTRAILEIGSGRGELQELFKKSSISSYGVELDSAMVEHCASKGLNVKKEDGLAHLTSLADKSLGGVIAIQVIEHLAKKQLENLFSLCAKKVADGGKVIFETINTTSLSALCHNYFRDPTHVLPIHPETIAYMMEVAGLNIIEIKKISPFPKEVMLHEVSIEGFYTPRWQSSLETLNQNIRQLNDLLYAPQDYFILASA